MKLPPPRSPRSPDGRFVNWAGTVETRPARWHEPARHDEVAELVRAAARAGQRVRVVGAGHSWSEIAAPHEVAVSLDRLAGLESVDRERGLAVARAGTRIRQLQEALAERGLTLPIVGSVDHQSIAGATATGTHGSSLVHGNLSSLVQGARLVTGSGDTVDVGEDDGRLDGVRVHLGALGVLTQLTLRVEPAFRLRETVESVRLDALPASLEAIARSAEYVKVWWFPHSPAAQVFRYARTTEPETRRPDAATRRWIDEVVLQRGAFRAVVALERRRPAWIPAINRLIARTFVHDGRVGAASAMLSTPMPIVHRETEAALPLARAGEAFERLRRLIEREALRVNFLAELRFVRGDDAWLSPAQGADTCQLGAYMGPVPGVDRYFAAFWRELRELGARPHWGKEHMLGVEEVGQLYPLAPRFRALRDALDPERRFATPYHTRTLGE